MAFPTPPEDSLFESGSNLMRQIYVAMIRLDSKVDGVNTRLNDLIIQFERRTNDHEDRIRKLENRQYVDPAVVQRLEDRPYVSPASVRWALGVVVAAASLVVAIISLTR